MLRGGGGVSVRRGGIELQGQNLPQLCQVAIEQCDDAYTGFGAPK